MCLVFKHKQRKAMCASYNIYEFLNIDIFKLINNSIKLPIEVN